ncbi:MAG: diguanylate cyclase [Nitrospinae bacterium]|nr:diguanylate cyclase [Nitrospinota bacterium]
MSKVNILIVEDDGITARDLEKWLTGLGYNVSAVVSSGVDAIKKAKEINPDIVLMDIKLSGDIDGIEAARQIHVYRNIPVIYLTAFSDKALLRRANITEPFGYVLKPFDEKELHITIEMALCKHKVAEELRLAKMVFENAMDGMMVTDARGTILSVNNAFTKITGYTPEEAIGKNPRLLKSGRQDAEFYKDFWDTLIAKGKWEGEIWNKRKNGEIYPEWTVISAVRNNQGNITHYIGVARDTTERIRYEEKIKYQAYHDTLTGLPNRLLFYDRLSVALSNAKRGKGILAVIFLDIDGFKPVNDTFGHDAGDILLQSITKRLMNCIRQGDTVARIGGDEFTLILPQVTQKEEVDEIARRLIDTIKESYLINKHKLYITASIGISFYPDDGEDMQTLMKKADIAMYSAKEKGKNNYQFYAG